MLQMQMCRKNQLNISLRDGGLLRMVYLILMMLGGEKGSSVLLPHQIFSATSLFCQKMESNKPKYVCDPSKNKVRCDVRS